VGGGDVVLEPDLAGEVECWGEFLNERAVVGWCHDHCVDAVAEGEGEGEI
jgi:hypothetical protein